MKKLIAAVLIMGYACLAVAGTYVEFRLKGSPGQSGSAGANGTLKAWYQDGNTRSQMLMDVPGGSPRIPGIPDMSNMIVLLLKDQPDKTYMLDEKNRSYFVAPVRRGRDGAERKEEEYEVQIIGEEKMNGYNCTHVKAIRKSGGPKTEMECWVSKDVAGYKEMKDFRIRQFNTQSLYKSMESSGVEGFPVKMIVNGRGQERAMELELIKVETMDIPESRFTLDGYSKKETPAYMSGGMDPEKMKNMSPEERAKFFQEMQQQMQGMQKEAGEKRGKD